MTNDKAITITSQDEELFRALGGAPADRWFRPMDLGATDASWHSRRLARLCQHGFVERRERHGLAWTFDGPRGSYEYRLTKRGRLTLRGIRAQRGHR